MIGKLLLATGGLLAACVALDRRSEGKRADRRRVRRVDLPRWEGEGGSPPPDEVSDTPIGVDATTARVAT